MGAIDIAVALLRGVHVAAMVSLFGTLIFSTIVARAAMVEAGRVVDPLRRTLLRLTRSSALVALASGAVWLTLETAVIAGTDTMTRTLHAVPVVGFYTQFGQMLLLRGVLLLLTLASLRWSKAVAAVLAGIGLALQPLLGHAGAMGGGLGAELIAAETLHLIAAGAWLGGLLPLFIAVGVLPRHAAATACRSFTPVGLAAVLVLAGTAVVQVAVFMGGLPGLFGTGYGRIALVKVAAFLVLLALASLNRFALTNRLDSAAAHPARSWMRRSIAAEMVLGVVVIITAGFLASHTPGMHEQPVWPFAWRLSLDALAEPELRREVLFAFAAVGGAVVIGAGGMIWRRIRWPAIVFAGAIFALAVPHLQLLLVPAYPTSFYTSPTEFAATAIAHGARLFATNCARCHGAEGRGDGPAAASLPVRPADLTAEHLWAHSDGEMFWYLTHGFEAPDGGVTMPGFGGVLSIEARWDLVDYLRAHNAGLGFRQAGKWSHPLPLPQFDAACPDGGTIDLDDLRGRALIIEVASGDEGPMAAPSAGAMRIVLHRRGAVRPDPIACVATEPEAWAAFAIILGVAPDALTGARILADQNAWLRLAWRQGDAGSPADTTSLDAVLRDIVAHPLPLDTSSGHVHRH